MNLNHRMVLSDLMSENLKKEITKLSSFTGINMTMTAVDASVLSMWILSSIFTHNLSLIMPIECSHFSINPIWKLKCASTSYHQFNGKRSFQTNTQSPKKLMTPFCTHPIAHQLTNSPSLNSLNFANLQTLLTLDSPFSLKPNYSRLTFTALLLVTTNNSKTKIFTT